MSESYATSRSSGGAEEFERRMRTLAAAPDGQDDPLAELARLVGENDPFRSAKPQIRATVSRVDPKIASIGARRDEFASFGRDFRGALDAGEDSGAPDDPAIVHAAVPDAELPPLPLPRVPEVTPDKWARGAEPAVTPARDEPVHEGSSSRRTLIVLAAVVALTGGGLAASFLAKPSNASLAASTTASTPTILAATGPSKVQPETPAADPDAPSEPSTLLDKNKNDGTASAKVVTTVEQPVDLAQAVKPAASTAASGDAPAAVAPSPFPEPRKVKTILVRPDGSIITDRPAPPAADAARQDAPASEPSAIAFDPKTSLPPPPNPTPTTAMSDAAVPVAASTTPGATPRAGRAAAHTPGAGDTSVTQGRTAPAAPKAKPVAVAKLKPAEDTVATTPAPEAAEPAPPPQGSGKFAAQLGAAASEAEARGLSSTLSRKYADTVGGRLSVHKGQSGDKTVFRIRVSGLSQEAAKAVCGKVTAGGGGCFVARD